MSPIPVGILLITHAALGETLRATAEAILGRCPLPLAVLGVPMDADPELTAAEARRLATSLDQGAGVLILTDIHGATPGNIACRMADWASVRIISGLNLPMLLRTCNYHALELDALAEKALQGGRDGIQPCGCSLP